MSQKPKSGLQSGFKDVLAKQTAPIEDKTRKSAELISRFADPLPPPPTTSYHQAPPTTQEAAPKKDFARVANSINRDALPAGLFKGTSKKLYDALYQRTRGAITPKREIQIRQGDLMAWAGVSHNTLRAHLRHLQAVGLVMRKWELGDNEGAIYEIFIPEELDAPTPSSYHLLPPPTSTQNLGGGSTQKVVVGGGGQVPVESATYESPKTLIKTNTENDDEAFADLLSKLRETAIEVTGKEPSASERARWAEVADVLSVELKIAAARTNISSAPAFLAEHLRRRLWKKEKGKPSIEQTVERTSATPDTQLTPEQIKACLDCGGTGFYYPSGYEGGVAKCHHEKMALKAESEHRDSDAS